MKWSLCLAVLAAALLLGPQLPRADDTVPAAWLDKKITVEAAEASHPGISDERVERFPDLAKPFGGQSARWDALKAEMRPGDEIWTFSSPEESWRHLAGRSGVALVRQGKVIMTIVTLMN